jgi:hypothetical protein
MRLELVAMSNALCPTPQQINNLNGFIFPVE